MGGGVATGVKISWGDGANTVEGGGDGDRSSSTRGTLDAGIGRGLSWDRTDTGDAERSEGRVGMIGT